MFKRVNR